MIEMLTIFWKLQNSFKRETSYLQDGYDGWGLSVPLLFCRDSLGREVKTPRLVLRLDLESWQKLRHFAGVTTSARCCLCQSVIVL